MGNQIKLRRYHPLLLIVLVAFGLRLYRLSYQSFWWDEMWTAVVSSLPLREVIAQSLIDRIHPPFYLLFTHFWAGIGSEEFVLRYSSLIWGVLSIPLIYRLGLLFYNHATGLTAALLLALSPFHIWFSQDARMYPLITFTLMASTWFLLLAWRHNNRLYWVGYSLFLILSLYTHYMALFVLLAHYTFFAANHKSTKRVFVNWLISAGTACITFAPWVIYVMSTGGFSKSSIGWIPPATWSHPFLTLLTLSSGPTIELTNPLPYLLSIIFTVALLIPLYRFARGGSDDAITHNTLNSRFLASWLIVPWALVFLISLDLPLPQKRSIYMDRYLIVILPALFLLVSWGLAVFVSHKSLTRIMVLIVFVQGLAALPNLYNDPVYARTDWRSTMAQLGSQWQPADLLLLTPDQSLPSIYYLGDRLPYEIIPFPSKDGTQDLAYQRQVNSYREKSLTASSRIWVISGYANNDPHGFPGARNADAAAASLGNPILALLDSYNPPLAEWSFAGIRLTLYDFSATR